MEQIRDERTEFAFPQASRHESAAAKKRKSSNEAKDERPMDTRREISFWGGIGILPRKRRVGQVVPGTAGA
jgi:hypothetical protein